MNGTAFIGIIVLITVSTSLGAEPIFKCLPNQFQCNNKRSCVYKHNWCDNKYDCPDGSDERYCKPGKECKRKMYPCDNGACIPLEGRCDGYPSCSDGSDELDCPCEEISFEYGKINYSVHVGKKRISKCWRIVVPPNRYVSLTPHQYYFKNQTKSEFWTFPEPPSNHTCKEAVLKVSWLKKRADQVTLCPDEGIRRKEPVEMFGDTVIKYQRKKSRKSSKEGPTFDSFKMLYNIKDIQCKNPDAIKCSSRTCVSKDRRCDGVKDCPNGADEKKCELSESARLRESRIRATSWLMEERNAAWGWRGNTHRAVIALYLGQGATFNGSSLQEALTAKQLELRLSTTLLRNTTDVITPTQLAMYINALLVICRDPSNFYGINLVEKLQDLVQKASTRFQPLPLLTLCNAKKTLDNRSIENLLKVLETPSKYSFIADVRAVSLMALACAADDPRVKDRKDNVSQAMESLKNLQNPDGSFGNIYTTALVTQGIVSYSSAKYTDFSVKSAVQYLMKKQKANGSFGDFLSTYLILPILNLKSLADVGQVKCKKRLKLPRYGISDPDLQSNLGEKISVEYNLYIGDQKDQMHPIFLRLPHNSTVLQLMKTAARADQKYRFKVQKTGNEMYVFKMFGITNDPEDGKFWQLYIQHENSVLQMTNKSPNEVYLKNNDKVIMWYRSAELN